MLLAPRSDGPVPAGLPTDTTSNAASILAINGFFCGLTIIVVLLRIFVRVKLLKTMGIDDYLMAAAALCGLGVTICFVGETRHGVGRHTFTITPEEFVKLLHWQFFHSLMVTLGISLVKLSVGTFLLRLVPGKKYKIFLYSMIAFLVAFTFSSEGTILFSCVPIRASWDSLGEPHAKCFNHKLFTAIGMFNSCVNIVTDVIFTSLPIPMIWNLQVNQRTKASLICILSLGYFACAASIVKTIYQTTVFSNPDSTFNYAYFVWNSIELYIGILAASLPALRPLFHSILETTRSLRSRVASNSNTLNARHKYYVHEEGIGMKGLKNPTRSTVGSEGKKPYDATCSTTGTGTRVGMGSKSEENIVRADDSSEDLWPMRGIKKTVDVRIS